MSDGGSGSDDDHSETQEADERSDEDNPNENTEETDVAYDDSDEDDSGERSANPFLFGPGVQKALQSYGPLMINREVVERLQGPPIDPEVAERLQGPPIDPEVAEKLQGPPLDPEVAERLQGPDLEALQALVAPINPEIQRQLVQPAVDPEIIGQIKQPPINPQALESLQQTAENIRKLSEFTPPAIDQGILDVLQSVGDPTVKDAYETAAALDQIEQKSDEQKPLDDREEESDIETESLEEQETGGHVSTFFHYTATSLLFNREQLPEEAVESLENILQSESVQTKKENFKQVVSSLEEKSTRLLNNAAWGAIAFMLMYHFGPQTGEGSEYSEEERDDRIE